MFECGSENRYVSNSPKLKIKTAKHRDNFACIGLDESGSFVVVGSSLASEDGASELATVESDGRLISVVPNSVEVDRGVVTDTVCEVAVAVAVAVDNGGSLLVGEYVLDGSSTKVCTLHKSPTHPSQLIVTSAGISLTLERTTLKIAGHMIDA